MRYHPYAAAAGHRARATAPAVPQADELNSADTISDVLPAAAAARKGRNQYTGPNSPFLPVFVNAGGHPSEADQMQFSAAVFAKYGLSLTKGGRDARGRQHISRTIKLRYEHQGRLLTLSTDSHPKSRGYRGLVFYLDDGKSGLTVGQVKRRISRRVSRISMPGV